MKNITSRYRKHFRNRTTRPEAKLEEERRLKIIRVDQSELFKYYSRPKFFLLVKRKQRRKKPMIFYRSSELFFFFLFIFFFVISRLIGLDCSSPLPTCPSTCNGMTSLRFWFRLGDLFLSDCQFF